MISDTEIGVFWKVDYTRIVLKNMDIPVEEIYQLEQKQNICLIPLMYMYI